MSSLSSVFQYLLLNAVCASLLSKDGAPSKNTLEEPEGQWPTIVTLATDIAPLDSQFLLKVHVYLSLCLSSNYIVLK